MMHMISMPTNFVIGLVLLSTHVVWFIEACPLAGIPPAGHPKVPPRLSAPRLLRSNTDRVFFWFGLVWFDYGKKGIFIRISTFVKSHAPSRNKNVVFNVATYFILFFHPQKYRIVGTQKHWQKWTLTK